MQLYVGATIYVILSYIREYQAISFILSLGTVLGISFSGTEILHVDVKPGFWHWRIS